MTTFVDTNVLLDVFLPDPHWGKKSQKALETAYEHGSLIINEIIYAELSPQFPEKHLLDGTLKTLGIRIIPIDSDTAYRAGLPAGVLELQPHDHGLQVMVPAFVEEVFGQRLHILEKCFPTGKGLSKQ